MNASSQAAAPAAVPNGKRALLVGIDRYAHVSGLEGCVNDVRLMERLLVDTFGFPPSQVAVLTDDAATRDGILAALDQLVADTRPDDVVVFHYAGHGSQMTDREGDEASGMDNTLIPVDSGRDWSAQGGENWPNRDITDDELALRLDALAQRTRHVTLLVDACHSGTITRDAVGPTFGVRSRGIEPDTRPVSELPPSPIPPEARERLMRSAARSAGARTRDAGAPGLASPDGRYVLIAGCRDEERSYEYRGAETPGAAEVPHGALTFFLAQELAAVRPGTTYRDVFERASARVTAANREQHPQMEGAADREVFGVRDVAPMRHVRVLDVAGDRATLGTGAALGAAVGARYVVYPPGTKVAEGATQLGEVELVSVGAATSEARVVSGAVVADARAVERAAPAAARFAVELAGAVAADAAMRDAIAASPLLAVAGVGAAPNGSPDAVPNVGPVASARVHLLAPRAAAGPGDPVPQLGAVAAPTWAAVAADGQLLAPPKPLAARAEVVDALETVARQRRVLALANRDPASTLAGRFTLELLRQAADGTWRVAEPEAGGLPVFETGERIGFRVTSRHDAPAYVNVVDLGPTGYVGVVFPPPGAQDALAPGLTLDVTGRAPERKGWPLDWPKGFPFAATAGSQAADEGVETIKLVVTTAPADFSFLRQLGVRSADLALGRRGGTSQAERLLRDATGQRSRDLGEEEPVAAGDDWTTVDRPFVLRRATRAALAAGGAPVAVGGVTVHAAQAAGTVAAGPAEAPSATGDPLAQALGSSGATVRRTLRVDAVPTGPGTRDPGARDANARGGAAPAVDLEVPDPGPDLGQLVVSTDAAGVVSFHFAPAPEGATRDALAPGAAGARTFRVPVPAAAPNAERVGQPVERGDAPGARDLSSLLSGGVTKLVLKHVVFPLIDPIVGAVGEHFAGRWEAKYRPYRVRPFGPADYRQEAAPEVDAEGWRRLGAGRALLFVHGTFSRAHSAFGGLSQEMMDELARRYEGRLFAFDHYTLSEDPRDNLHWLVDRLPADATLDVDVVCHSRGGLVSRLMAERQAELSLGSRNVRVGRVVFVGAPNAGTTLADTDRMGKLIDTYATLLNLVPEPAAKEVLQGVVTVAKQLAVGVAKGLPGLQSMRPEGDFARALNAGGRDGTTRYFALTSDYEPRAAGLKAMLADRLMDGIFPAANDLVVPTGGVWEANGSGFFPIDDRRVLEGAESVAHTEFFGSAAARAQLLEWLRPE